MSEKTIHDVCIVGAGPAGSTCAYYLAQKGIIPLVLEKKEFPRDKICGDAFTLRAQAHLEKMGLLQKLIGENKGRWTSQGGIVSPRGIVYTGDSYAETKSHLVISIKRKIIDEMLVKTAVEAGSILMENYSVKEVTFNKNSGYWTIHPKEGENQPNHAKILIIADGASSRIAQSLGIIKGPPQAVCSRSYVKAGTYEFNQEGIVVMSMKLVPGYCALMKEADDDLVFCCYIIPFGKTRTENLYKIHHDLIESDPFISKALGPSAEIEEMKAAPIRFGGTLQSYDNQLLIVGDAAGMIDPLTGEGLQYAMDAAEIAADIIVDAFRKNNFTMKFLKQYQKRWMKSFGKDFKWSTRMARFCAKHPIFFDAFASLSQKKGDKFMVEWGKIMTGSKRKLNFFLPKLALPLVFEVIRLKRKFKKEKVL
ncbi:MAG: NAD(P)/FAD-dependent oxidoreductase [Promethearchaeota archaeon]|nr:MAG: NAD(P)/FAD-dependent oxidoreductase [Candidatus Lokiarchaeota archaeon]